MTVAGFCSKSLLIKGFITNSATISLVLKAVPDLFYEDGLSFKLVRCTDQGHTEC